MRPKIGMRVRVKFSVTSSLKDLADLYIGKTGITVTHQEAIKYWSQYYSYNVNPVYDARGAWIRWDNISPENPWLKYEIQRIYWRDLEMLPSQELANAASS